ncbi:26S proteasome non-ATPase regulatory subunit 3 [Thamnocephalis sphaerospora]|uniref:26S proteasome regulatory subunit RPN3 n=1 Tax=Thamnocephalis sphaerospora TaxID=78915 RepID=A0A4V1IWG4_9FUNG|nr:26S proteasome non-ATPase regulatory subunit 3 [Thamnocephalis sphaerospora]|eukprot:RKP07469.1 26S proteasome non-ATPase regulatory subunit 3 [Thamnocephalis sphaerospora]
MLIVFFLAVDITQNFYLLQKAVATIEARFTTRVIRTLVSIRRRMDAEALTRAIQAYKPLGDEQTDKLLAYLKQSDAQTAPVPIQMLPLPEIDMYLSLLVLIWLIDQKKLEHAHELSQTLVDQIGLLNRRTLDQIAARIFFYYARVFELLERSAEIRPALLAAHRTANLRRDDELQATLINLLLRNYFQHKLYEQADHLVSKATFPESASNSQFARYLYYLGRIKALQLDYTESHKHLTMAIRKAPQHAAAAGFLQSVYKFSIIVQLLMGEIPERSIFRQPMLRKALIPYFHLTQAVRIGDLTQFQETLAKHADTFHADSTSTLILRQVLDGLLLRHNVIKTGVRMINLSYSRISLRDICLKLQLDSEEDAEYIVAKAIRDGVIDATIDHEHGYIQSKENADVYSTTEPQHAFDQRITFCLALHDESVKVRTRWRRFHAARAHLNRFFPLVLSNVQAMRYPNTERENEDEDKQDDLKSKEGTEPEDDIADLMGGLDDF